MGVTDLKSIKTKMMVLLGALLVVVCTGMGFLSYDKSTKALLGNNEESLTQIASEAAALIESKINSNYNVLEIIAKNVGNPKLDEAQRNSEFKSQEVRGGYLFLGLANSQGILTTARIGIIDIKEMDIFQKAMKGENAVSEPMEDIFGSSMNSMVVVYAIPMKKGNSIDSVLIAVKYGNEFSLLTNDITYGKTGNTYMVNEKGDMIAHNNLSFIVNKTNFINESETDRTYKLFADTLTHMIHAEAGVGEYLFEGKMKYAGYSPIAGTGWSIAVTADKSEILSELASIKSSAIIFSVIFLALGSIIIYIIASNITNSLAVIVDNIRLMANGDLTKKIPVKYLLKKDEVGVLAQSTTTLQTFMKEIIDKIKESSANIDDQSENLSAISQEMTSASENVTSSIQEVANGVGFQAANLTNMIGTLNEFADELDKIILAIQDIDKNADHISSMTENSNASMQSLIASSNVINQAFKDFMIKITNLGVNVKQINEIATFINNIADQTNLLALNAAIEAARAGEAGRGFAVVADQIRKLAEQTKNSSANINTIIIGVSNEADSMVKGTDDMEKKLKDQVTVLGKTIEVFSDIMKAINVITPEIEAVSASAIELDGKKNTIITKMEEVASISEEISASAQEIAASAEEMNASMEEVAAAALILTSKTDEMKERVERFQIIG
jgi:methyl-accepting chemotaxis protein